MAVDLRPRTILLVSFVALTFSVALSIRSPLWQDQWETPRSVFDTSDKDQKNIEDECNNTDGQCDFDKGKELLRLIDLNEIPYKRRPNSHLSNVEKLMQMDTKSGIIPYFHTSSLPPLPCSCGAHYRLMDLGRAYYPRYLPTAVCDPAACGALGTYHCRPRPYHVRVLRRKDVTSPPEQQPEQVANPPLPEVLRMNWILETFTVTVACECGP